MLDSEKKPKQPTVPGRKRGRPPGAGAKKAIPTTPNGTGKRGRPAGVKAEKTETTPKSGSKRKAADDTPGSYSWSRLFLVYIVSRVAGLCNPYLIRFKLCERLGIPFSLSSASFVIFLVLLPLPKRSNADFEMPRFRTIEESQSLTVYLSQGEIIGLAWFSVTVLWESFLSMGFLWAFLSSAKLYDTIMESIMGQKGGMAFHTGEYIAVSSTMIVVMVVY